MFAPSYFAPTYFPPTYFPVGGTGTVAVPGSPDEFRTRVEWEDLDPYRTRVTVALDAATGDDGPDPARTRVTWE